MTLSSTIKDFLKKMNINLVDSNKRVRHYRVPIHRQPVSFTGIMDPAIDTYEEEILHTLQISQSDLEYLANLYQRLEESMRQTGSMDIFNHYIERERQDKAIRNNHAAVQKAYDHYQMLYKLAKSGNS